MTHLLVTNDFPPKIGGIQSYLWELWRRLDPTQFAVLTPDHPGAAAFDATQAFAIERVPARLLLPTPALTRRVRARSDVLAAELVAMDPVLPLAWIGTQGLGRPYVVLVHGAEMTVPGGLPGSAAALRRVLHGAAGVIASGTYPADAACALAGRQLPVSVVPPGVDCERFRPPTAEERAASRAELGVAAGTVVVVTVSRLVPRKGIDVLIAACRLLAGEGRDLTLVVAGEGRDRARLARMAAAAPFPVHFLGRVAPGALPSVLGCGDVFAMLCRNRWGGLEQEGFGIVLLEAAACGLPVVVGASGGAADAVADGRTGRVVARPADPAAAAAVLAPLLDDAGLRARMGAAARRRCVEEFSHDRLAVVLGQALAAAVDGGQARR